MKKLAIICMILLFSMGTVGMGYAGWYEVISAKYDVVTGTVCAGIRNHGVNDYGPDPCCHGGPNSKGRDIGYARCQDGPYEYELDGKSYSENVTVDICGYRSYAPVCTLEMANCGSIPVKVDQLMIDWDGDLAGNIQVGKWSVDCPDGYRKKGQGLASLENTIKYICIDSGQKMWLDLEFRVGGKIDREDTLDIINEALRTVLKTEIAEASEVDKVLSSDTETNSMTEESAPVSECESKTEATEDSEIDEASSGDTETDSPAAEPAPVPEPDNLSSPAESLAEESSCVIPAEQPGDESEGELSSDVPVYTLTEMPASKSAKGSSAPEIKCGSVTGTITITYRRWNEKW